MDKEFVTYEQALALKELGFDERCFTRYYESGKLSDSLSYLHHNYFGQVNAPLKQQAFKWFREKYKLTWEHQFDDGNISLYVGEIAYPDNNLDFFKIIEVEYDGYNKAHEEAELACLIKLIEIVKTNDSK